MSKETNDKILAFTMIGLAGIGCVSILRYITDKVVDVYKTRELEKFRQNLDDHKAYLEELRKKEKKES